ncbi:MAG: transglycosylase SLT domain-containing protein [Acidithiobacillus sp.]
MAAVTAGLSFFFVGAPQPLQRTLPRFPVKMTMPLSHGLEPVRDVITSTATPAPRRAWRRLAGIYSTDVRYAAKQTGLSRKLIAAVVHVETHSQNLVSSAGAIGPMQLMPTTAWKVLHVDPWQPRSNIIGGARYLRRLLTRFHGQLRLALEAYNAGPTAVAEGVIPIPAVTYAKQVMALAA